MGQTVRVSLPGYNALTDTNLDHFSLYADIDNVLIKRLLIGSQTIAAAPSVSPNYTLLTIPHNLGYIPFFMVYDVGFGSGSPTPWEILYDSWNPIQVPSSISFADTNNLFIVNFNSGSTDPVYYDIFYDDMSQTGIPAISESSQVIKVTRPGKNTNSTNPNDYIMHSDLNNFKILKQGNITISVVNGISTITVAHGAAIQDGVKFFLFANCPDGKVIFANETSYDTNLWLISVTADVNNLYIKCSSAYSATVNVPIYYLIYGSGKNNTVNNTNKQILAVSASGKDVLTETNPDNYNFHSDYPTLKYLTEGTYSMTVTTTTTITIPHNLGYIPFFIGFINDISGNSSLWSSQTTYCIIPFLWGRSTLSNPSQNIYAFIYADATNIYLQAYYQPNAVGTSVNFSFYYKIFKNNLGF